MVNLSVNVFGENLNLLEVGGRVEGLENTIEGMFGPEGHFKEDTLQKIFRSVSGKFSFTFRESDDAELSKVGVSRSKL